MRNTTSAWTWRWETAETSLVEVLRIGRGQQPDVQVAEWRGWINPTDLAKCSGHRLLVQPGRDRGRGQQRRRGHQQPHLPRLGILSLPLEVHRQDQQLHHAVLRLVHQSKTRPLIIVKGREAIMEKTIVMRSEDLVDEMMAFTREEDEEKFMGRGTPDDRVMAFLIARYCAHEFDYADQVATHCKVSVATNETFYIFDDQNRLRFTSDDREQPRCTSEHIRDGRCAGNRRSATMPIPTSLLFMTGKGRTGSCTSRVFWLKRFLLTLACTEISIAVC